MRKVVNISLPEHLYKEVEKDIEQGRYATKSELFREILRTWKQGKFRDGGNRFDAKGLLKNVRKHAGVGGPKDLSEKHDIYLYGE